MGIDLGDVVVRRPATLARFSGQRLAFDAWNILYQFLASIRGPDGTPLMDQEGRITSHLAGILTRTGNLVEAGIRPVFCFDGQPHPLKRETLAQRQARKERAQEQHDAAIEAGDLATARTKAQQTSRLTPPMVASARELLDALGIPVVQAPGEGEAQAAWMATQGLVDGVVSQDFDALLFGAPLLVRHLGVGGRRKLPGKQVWVDASPEEIPLALSLAHAGCGGQCPVRAGNAPATAATLSPPAPAAAAAAQPPPAAVAAEPPAHAAAPAPATPGAHTGITREQLIDAALLVGTDFHPGVKGIGAKKAVAMVHAAGSLDALLARLTTQGAKSAAERYILEQVGSLDVRDEVRAIFLAPAHDGAVGDLTVRPPDVERVKEIMVGRHGFNPDRVEAALAKYQAGRGRQAQQRLF